MGRKLSPWCKRVKIAMIQADMNMKDLAEKIGMTREYTSSIVNGRTLSESAIRSISDCLNIQNDCSMD